VALTEDQMSALDDILDDFKAAGYKVREEMVQDFLGSFTSTRTQGVRFDKTAVETVCAPLATLSFSHKSLAYSTTSLWKNQACGKKFPSRY
jgi:hypothetical protein